MISAATLAFCEFEGLIGLGDNAKRNATGAWHKDYGCLTEQLTKILFIKGLVTSLILGVTIPCLTPILPKGTANFSFRIIFSTVPNRKNGKRHGTFFGTHDIFYRA